MHTGSIVALLVAAFSAATAAPAAAGAIEGNEGLRIYTAAEGEANNVDHPLRHHAGHLGHGAHHRGFA